jgi:hypothetical protein
MNSTYLRELLSYCQDTGNFYWRVSRGQAKIGGIAGSENEKGYLRITINCKRYLAHRLAFLYMTGSWPEFEVDHINGVRSDNRWHNIRPCNRGENNQNMVSRTKSKLLGVSKNRDKWISRITIGNVNTYLGTFDTQEQAHIAYREAKKLVHKFQPTPR